MKQLSPDCIRAARRPLAAGIASLLALTAAPTFASSTNHVVSSCDDSGPGTLRAVIGDVATLSGDTIDLSGLTCTDSTISLSTGEIFVLQDSLTIVGPGRDLLTIDGSNLPGGSTIQNDSRIFTHKGSGTLTLQAVRLDSGHSYHTAAGYLARGGCVYSTKNVTLQSAMLKGCSATSQGDKARGGAVYAKGNVTLDDSIVTGNAISGAGYTTGGGIWAKGTIAASYSTISGNTASSQPKLALGGGVYAFGGGSIVHSVVADNAIATDTFFAEGAGVYSRGDLTLSFATVTGNTATAANNGTCGGGAFVFGNLTVAYSTIDGNHSVGLPMQSAGGGLCMLGSLTMNRSTVSNNTTSGYGGGIDKFDNCVGCNRTLSLRDSTVSGNSANKIGGIYATAAHTKLYNSTIAFNTAASAKIGAYTLGPGVTISAFLEPADVTIHSMLMSNNTYGAGVEDDLSVSANKEVTFNAGPANSLIRASSAAKLPSGINPGACPLLGPLRDNGGLTKTHALQSTSPAIDTGDNLPINIVTLDVFDQRGAAVANGQGDYFRVSGPSGNPTPLPDIGAYEVQQDDVVFNSAFDGCPALP